MPYRWQDETAHSGPALEDTPHGNAARNRGRLVIWPHRSLPAAGFAWVIGLAAAGLALLAATASLLRGANPQPAAAAVMKGRASSNGATTNGSTGNGTAASNGAGSGGQANGQPQAPIEIRARQD